MKALVVENDLKSQCLLAKVLAERGHEVTTFENAEQAILAYQKDFYPLLFVDVGLPGMDGLQYCRWIRSQPCGERTYVIAAIEPTLPAEVQQVLEAGANDFLTKPYQLEQLRARLAIGERQMSQFFDRQQLEENLQSETQRWSMAEAELMRTREEFELLLGAKDSELSELREKLDALAANHEQGTQLTTALSEREVELERLRDQIGELGGRCERLDRALAESRQECSQSREKVQAAERALESANLELTRLRGVEEESTVSLKETLKCREQELACLERELIEAQEELTRRGREQLQESLRLADECRVMAMERRRLETELGQRDQQREAEQSRLVMEREQLLQRLNVQSEETNRLRAALAEMQERRAMLEETRLSALEELKVHRDARQRLEARWRTAMGLGAELNRAATAEDVARVAGLTTQELVGWDRFSFDAYAAEGDWTHPVLNLESADGRTRPTRPMHPGPQPGSLLRRVIEDGPQLILRPAAFCNGHDPVVVDNRVRKSASIICVPMMMVGRMVGFLTLRSSVENAYRVEDLAMLEMLAAHCAGALERIEARLGCESSAVREPAPLSGLAVQVGS